jgi:DNA (cytosine-5)-methyltransferase 1
MQKTVEDVAMSQPDRASRPKALDLFCGAGGAAMGLYRAGFDVVGIDIKPQPRYPFPFILGDALQPPMRLSDFDLIWASPPCQGYSIMRNLPWLRGREYPMLIPAVREMLMESGVAYVMENVNQARRRDSLPEGINGGFLCGTMFGLPVYRHRRFETSFFWLVPAHPRHEWTIRGGHDLSRRSDHCGFTRPRYGFDHPNSAVGKSTGVQRKARQVLDVPWMRADEACQAIPPAYSQHIGTYAMMALGRSDA